MSDCFYFDESVCTSCSLLALPYSEQIRRKEATLAESFVAAGFKTEISSIVGSTVAFASRNKAKMAVGGSSAKPLLGYADSEFRIVDIDACPLHVSPIPDLLVEIKRLISEHGLRPYDITNRQGELKYVLIRASEATAQQMVRFVLRSRAQLDSARDALLKLQHKFPAVVVISVNIQPIPQAIIEGPEEVIFSKQDFLIDELAGKRLVFSPQSFSQVTSNVATKLYEFVASVVEAAKVRSLLDLYCGVGAFSVVSAAHIERGQGVELNSQAIENAKQACLLNAIENLSFAAADAEQFLTDHHTGVDAVVVNPPRRGLSEKIIQQLFRVEPNLLIYSSCNAESLLRDLSLLQERFVIKQIQPFDMFPLTSHLETVVVLDRKR